MMRVYRGRWRYRPQCPKAVGWKGEAPDRPILVISLVQKTSPVRLLRCATYLRRRKSRPAAGKRALISIAADRAASGVLNERFVCLSTWSR
jgi:hypothetical protein